jgi:polysaccharide export outer membrane protein
MLRKALFLILLVVVASASFGASTGDYVLAPDDVVSLNVWQEPTLSSKQIQITTEGNLTVPFVNHVIKAAGLTQQELAQKIAEEYKTAEILVDPKVDITLVGRHEMTVWVLGQVQRPGAFTFKEGNTVTSAIAQAGSYSADARLESATLTRKGSDKPLPLDLRKLYRDGELSQNYPLQEGDVIYVPEDNVNRYYVLGEVKQPGLYFLKDNATALSAVSLAGGATERGSMKGVMIVRGDAKNPQKIPVDLNKIAKGSAVDDTKLQAGDVVYVPETSKPDWNKVSQIINIITSVGLIRRYGIF